MIGMANIIKTFFTYERLIHSHAAVLKEEKDGTKHHWVPINGTPEQLTAGMEFKLPDGTVCKLIERGVSGAGPGWWAEKIPKQEAKSKDATELAAALAKTQAELDDIKAMLIEQAKHKPK